MECFYVKAGRLRCHGAASADCLDAEILFSQNGIKFHLNLLQRWWEILHSGGFYTTLPRMYFFWSSEYVSLCVFTHWSAPEVCLMWPDAEKELLFRFQSLPNPHLGAMSHRRLLAVIDLRSGTLWHCWKKKKKIWLPNAVLLSSVYYPVKLITFIIFKAPQSGWKGFRLSKDSRQICAGWRDLHVELSQHNTIVIS